MPRPFAVHPEEGVLIRSALKFANLKSIDSTAQVENIFSNVPLIGPVFKVIPERDRAAYESDQKELRGWLHRITKSVRDRKAVARLVPRRLQTVQTAVTFHDGRIYVQFALSGVQACYSYATALILDKQRALTNKLTQCGWSGCGRFRLDFSPKGRPRKYCDRRHKWRAEAEVRDRP